MTQIRTLIVDDYHLFRQALVDILAPQIGFDVVGEAKDGFEAIEKARIHQPDLILTDMSMPGCDGLEATRWIKKALPEVAILILTLSSRG